MYYADLKPGGPPEGFLTTLPWKALRNIVFCEGFGPQALHNTVFCQGSGPETLRNTVFCDGSGPEALHSTVFCKGSGPEALHNIVFLHGTLPPPSARGHHRPLSFVIRFKNPLLATFVLAAC